MKLQSREQTDRLYAILKSKRSLAEFIDYEESFLKSLSDSDYIFLVNFLEEHYDSPGKKDYRGTTWGLRNDAMSGDCCISISNMPEHVLPTTETETYFNEPFLFLKILPLKPKIKVTPPYTVKG
jgi:hypothetical protein